MVEMLLEKLYCGQALPENALFSCFRNPKVVTELAQWNLRFEDDLQKIEGRQLPQETVMMVDRGNRDCAVRNTALNASWPQNWRIMSTNVYAQNQGWEVTFENDCFHNTD